MEGVGFGESHSVGAHRIFPPRRAACIPWCRVSERTQHVIVWAGCIDPVILPSGGAKQADSQAPTWWECQHDECRTNVMDVFNPSIKNVHVVLQSWTNSVSSILALKSSQVQNVSHSVQTILEPWLVAASCQLVNPLLRCPLSDIYREFFGVKQEEQLAPFDCQVRFSKIIMMT